MRGAVKQHLALKTASTQTVRDVLSALAAEHFHQDTQVCRLRVLLRVLLCLPQL